MTRISKIAIAAAAVLSLVGVAGCGTDSAPASTAKTAAPSSAPTEEATPSDQATDSSADASAQPAAPVVLTIKDFAYEGPGTVKPGTMITVKNDDTAAHTVTADGAGGFDVILPPGKSATFKAPDAAGSYKYHCTYHANMHGTLTVA